MGRITFMAFGVVILALVSSVALVGKGQVRRAAAFWAAWIFPGLGHVILGRWRKGLFFAGSLISAFVVGLWICGWRVVTWDENPFYFVGQFGCGLLALVGSLLGGDRPFRSDIPMSWYDPGLLYA